MPTFGKTSVGLSAEFFGAQRERLDLFTGVPAGKVSKLSLYVKDNAQTAGTKQKIKGLLYAVTSASEPAALLGETEQIELTAPITAGWIDLNFAAPITIPAGSYFIGVMSGATSNVIGWNYDSVTNDRRWKARTYTSGPLSGSEGGWTTDSLQMSCYATFEEAPQVTNPGNQSSHKGTATSLQIVASNVEAFGYSATNLPEGMSIGIGSGLISGTPTTIEEPEVTVTCKGSGGTTSVKFKWAITPPAGAPVITKPADQVNTRAIAITGVQVVASNVEAGGYSASGLPAGLTINATTGLITGTPTNLSAGKSVTITCKGGGFTETSIFNWAIVAAPTITTPPTQVSELGHPDSLSIEPSGQASYTATGLPKGLTLNSGTGQIAGTPTKIESPTVTIKAFNNASGPGPAEASTTFTWQVIAATVPPVAPAYISRVRQRMPLDLTVNISDPSGFTARWGWDDPETINVPMALSFSTAMPGGFERMSCTLERDSSRSYSDTAQLAAMTTVAGTGGGSTAWEGRVEKTPDTGGFQQQETIECVGMQAHMEDDNSAREIFIDQELSRWQAATTNRKIGVNNFGDHLIDATVGPGPSLPALITQFAGPWTLPAEKAEVSEGWYDGKGIPIGYCFCSWQVREAGKVGDLASSSFAWTGYLSTNEFTSALDTTGNLSSAALTGSAWVNGTTATKLWAFVQFYTTLNGGTNGVEYSVYWPQLAIYGYGPPRAFSYYAIPGGGGATGPLASDVIAYALSKWAPKIKYSTGPEGTIQPTSFIIPQLVFLDPTTMAEMAKQAMRFELPDWAIWEGPTMWLNPRGARGRHWFSRVGPAQLQQTGPQISRVWNGVIVQYTDTAGAVRTVGPVGSGSNTETSTLLDTDPENPLNKPGVEIRRWGMLKMGTSTVAGAEKVGETFLRESKLLDTSGTASVIGHCEDSSGIFWPAWMIRAGDYISFVDAAIPGPRRIVHTNYDDASRTMELQLDQPPASLTALLERLSVVLVPLGLS